MKKKRIILILVIVGILGLGGWILLGGSSGRTEVAGPSGQVQRVVTVEKGDLNLLVSANGVVQPINKVEIRSKAGGQIVEMNFIEGQYVEKGDLLLLVDQTIAKNDLEQSRADLQVAEANLTQSENSNNRTKELFLKQLVSQQEVDQSNTELVRAQAQLVKAKASLSNAEDKMRDTRIIAPASGLVLSKNVELGQIISSATSNVGGGTLLATVANMDEVYVYTKVDEVDIGRVRVGQKAVVIADAFPDDRFEGRVIRIAPQGVTQQNVTSFDVIVQVRNENAKLKAGMSTSVDIEVFNRHGVLLAPNEALKDPNSDQGKALMAEGNLTIPKEPAKEAGKEKTADQSGNDRQSFRERMQKMSPEEREKYRAQMAQRFQNMSPEEREQMRQRMGSGQGGGGQMQLFAGPGAESSTRPRRQAQVSNENDVRWRVTVVRDSGAFKPRLVKAGPSNFDKTEILEGLNEGDELQVTTISRAKLAAEQMNERMRSMSGIGGMTGGSARVTTGGGRR